MAKSKKKSLAKSAAKPPEQSRGLVKDSKHKRYRTKLLAHAESVRGKRELQVEPETLARLLAAEDALNKVNLRSEKEFDDACELVSSGIEEVYPLREKNIFYRLHTWNKYRKIRKQMLHQTRITRSMNEDVFAPEIIEECREAEKAFKKTPIMDFLAFRKAGKRMNDAVRTIQPPEKVSRVKENLEIAVVAIAVALGLRTYFVQPFRIPTGSMQPTLYGQTFELSPAKSGIFDKQFIPGSERNAIIRFANVPRTLKGFFTGHWHIQHHAPATGDLYAEDSSNGLKVKFWVVDSVTKKPTGHSFAVPAKGAAKLLERFGRDRISGETQLGAVTKGDKLVSGYLVSGDSILVNKIAYNYRKPERGEIFVFNTRNIDYPGIRKGDHYIKRLVGLPGEEVDVRSDGKLTADGVLIDKEKAFQRQYLRHYDISSPRLYGDQLESEKGQQGYQRRGPMPIQLAEDEYLPMGDNTTSSLDGRYFGGVNRRDVLGPAFMIYWPFFRFGTTDNDFDEWGL